MVRVMLAWSEKGALEHYQAEQMYSDEESARSALDDWMDLLGITQAQVTFATEDLKLIRVIDHTRTTT